MKKDLYLFIIAMSSQYDGETTFLNGLYTEY